MGADLAVRAAVPELRRLDREVFPTELARRLLEHHTEEQLQATGRSQGTASGVSLPREGSQEGRLSIGSDELLVRVFGNMSKGV